MRSGVSLHLGAHKTASTHLQRALEAASPDLNDLGIAVLTPRTLRMDALSIAKLVKEPVKKGNILKSLDPTSIAEGLHAATSGAERTLISEENILGPSHHPDAMRQRRFYPRAAMRLNRLLQALSLSNVSLYLAIRDPATQLSSVYSQRLLGKGYVSFDAFIQDAHPVDYLWSDLVERLLDVKGVRDCTVWRYEDYPGVAPKVLRHMVGDEAADLVKLDRKPAHQGLSEAAYQQLIVWAALSETGVEPDVQEARKMHPRSAGTPGFVPFDDKAILASRQTYEADLKRLAVLPGVRFVSGGAD